MRTIISNERVDNPIRLGEIIKWAPDENTEPVTLIAENYNNEFSCDGCPCKGHSCNVFVDYRNDTHSMSICCMAPSRLISNDDGASYLPKFCKLKKLDTIMEDL